MEQERDEPKGVRRMRLRKLLALLLIIGLCFAAGVAAEAQYQIWQPVLDAGEDYLVQATADLPGWFNPDTIVAVIAGGLIVSLLVRIAGRLRAPRRTPPVPEFRDRVAEQRTGFPRARS